MKTSLLLGAVSALMLLPSFVHGSEEKRAESEKPNIVFIFTDDQDFKLNSLDYMPNVQKHLVQEGTVYNNHYATIAVCCPSRVGLLRGQYAHNTNITDVLSPFGGYDRFNRLKLGEDYLPIWLKNAGYNTNYIGKLMNEYTVFNYDKPVPKGFDYQDQLLDPYTYVYNSAVFSKNGEPPVYYKDVYQTDVIHAKTRATLKRLEKSEDPFFLWVSPMAPHGEVDFYKDGSFELGMAIPAERHKHYFPDIKVPRTPHFNPDTQYKTASYWKDLKKLGPEFVEILDEAYRNRLRALQAVDELVGSVFEQLEKQGKLDNTYIIYSADNGYHLGQHRAYPGKCTNMEEDINVPFIVRGPGVPKGQTSDIVSSHHDIAPTLLALAKGDEFVPSWVDGGVIPLTPELENHPKPVSKESFTVEFWSWRNLAEYYDTEMIGPNTYKTLRIISNDYNYMYAVWCTGEHELYDLKEDPYELNNLYNSANIQLVNRLDALLVVLKSCRAETCRDPWQVLHPYDDDVKTLADALDTKYDAHYAQFRKVEFQECLDFKAEWNELPSIGNHFISNSTETKNSKPLLRNQQTDQHLFNNVKHSIFGTGKKTKKVMPKELYEIYKLIPTTNKTVGHEVPGESFEEQAIPVPKELKETYIPWADYNFYGVGS